MVSEFRSLADYSHIDDAIVSCAAILVVVTNENVLHLMGGESHDLFLIGVQNLTTIAFRVEVRDEGSRIVSSSVRLVSDNRLCKAEIVGDTLNDILVDGLAEQVERLLSVGSPGDELADHGVVVHADFATFLDACVDADVLMRIRLLVFGEEAD